MIKKILVTLMLVVSVFAASAQEPGNYKKIRDRFVEFYRQNLADSIFGLFSATTKAAVPVPMVQTIISQFGELKAIEFSSFKLPIASYKITFANAVLTMKLSLTGNDKIHVLNFVPYQPDPVFTNNALFKEEAFSCELGYASLSGTLTIPAIGSKFPVALIIAGSGPTNRDGNSPLGVDANSYKMLAETLAMKGIASLRYDKRDVGRSISKKGAASIFDDLVNDVVGIARKLNNDPRISNVIIIGHSEGSLIGMIAAKQAPTDAFISLSGAGRSADQLIFEQITANKAITPADKQQVKEALANLKGGRTTKTDPKYDMLFNAGLQPYLISWFKYDPQQQIKNLTIPVLILQGDSDIQVSIADAQLLKGANPNAVLHIISGMNHVLKASPADRAANFATYSNPDLPLKPELAELIAAFILKLR